MCTLHLHYRYDMVWCLSCCVILYVTHKLVTEEQSMGQKKTQRQQATTQQKVYIIMRVHNVCNRKIVYEKNAKATQKENVYIYI